MQFSVAVLALAAAVAATSNDTVSYATEVTSAYVTYCSESTQISYNGQTYTVTAPGTVTLTSGPYTVTKPVYTTSSVSCSTPAVSSPAYANSTAPIYPVTTPSYPGGTGSPSAPIGTPTPSGIISNGGNKAIAVSGAGLTGLLAIAAFLL